MRELPPLPKHRLGRPRDDRGYPIPYTVLIRPDGKPDFRIIDQEKARDAGQARRCALVRDPDLPALHAARGPKWPGLTKYLNATELGSDPRAIRSRPILRVRPSAMKGTLLDG